MGLCGSSGGSGGGKLDADQQKEMASADPVCRVLGIGSFFINNFLFVSTYKKISHPFRWFFSTLTYSYPQDQNLLFSS